MTWQSDSAWSTDREHREETRGGRREEKERGRKSLFDADYDYDGLKQFQFFAQETPRRARECVSEDTEGRGRADG